MRRELHSPVRKSIATAAMKCDPDPHGILVEQDPIGMVVGGLARDGVCRACAEKRHDARYPLQHVAPILGTHDGIRHLDKLGFPPPVPWQLASLSQRRHRRSPSPSIRCEPPGWPARRGPPPHGGATRSIISCAFARASGDSARIVPTNVAVSGMTFWVVPPAILPNVTTIGSNTLNRRVTAAWMARTISAPTGTGSNARWGAESMATHAGDRDLDLVGGCEHRARPVVDRARPIHGCHVQGEGPRRGWSRVQQPLIDLELGSVMSLFARLEHEHDRARKARAPIGEQPRCTHQHGRMEIMATSVHGCSGDRWCSSGRCPRASARRPCLLAGRWMAHHRFRATSRRSRTWFRAS